MRIFDYDPKTGITQWFHHDPDTHVTTIHSEQDVEPELEASKQLANNPDYWKKGVKQEMAHYAHIPNNILELWLRQDVNISDNDELFRMVNKPEWKYLRVTTKFHGSRN